MQVVGPIPSANPGAFLCVVLAVCRSSHGHHRLAIVSRLLIYARTPALTHAPVPAGALPHGAIARNPASPARVSAGQGPRRVMQVPHLPIALAMDECYRDYKEGQIGIVHS